MALLAQLPRKFRTYGMNVSVNIIASSPIGLQDEELRGHPKFKHYIVDHFEPGNL